ncbi:MAG: epoxyqueuosine reductase QueH [Treponema sp.]|nr:epoxyqueuosine reductase QueH [Treponema sp.]
MKLLLHCCCAPCTIGCVKYLRDNDGEDIQPNLFWYNPNIHPLNEYKSRFDTLTKYAADEKINLISINEYGLKPFLHDIFPDIENRCEKCYRIRLEKTASFAAQEKYDAYSTTLFISPYQDHELIKKIGEEAANKYNIEFLYRDFRPIFRESQAEARSRNFYTQKYCGCIFSEEENISKKSFTQRHGDTENTENKKGFNINNLRAFEPPCDELFKINPIFERLVLLIGNDRLEKLTRTHVMIVGLGGVGSWAAEALVRSGIGKITIIDNDTICASNINRQIQANVLTLGQPKTSVLKKRLLEINPDCQITEWNELFCKENARKFEIEKRDYVIDAIDTLDHKLDLIEIVSNTKVKLFSSMGMALKMDPTQIKTASIWKTQNCSLARLVRQGLRKRNFNGDFISVYSDEPVNKNYEKIETHDPGQKRINGSIVTVTASAGFLLANLVLHDILEKNNG